MRITLLTATGAYNLGDELILKEEYEYLRERYPNAVFTIFTYDPESSLLKREKNIRFVSYFPNRLRKRPLANLYFLFANIIHIATSDLLVIWGGGLIYDNEQGQSFQKLLLEWKIRIQTAKICKVSVFYWSLWIHVSEKNTQKILPLFSGKNITVSVRDLASKKTLAALGIQSVLVNDPVLLYDPILPKLLPKRRPKIGLALRSGYLKDEIDTIERIITFLQKSDYELILLNHSFHPDNGTSNDCEFLAWLQEKYSLSSTKTLEETLETYKELEFVIAMRLHSMILSIVHAIPFLALSYSKKTDEFIRNIGYEAVLTTRVFNIEIFKERFSMLEQNRKDVQFALERKNDTIKREILVTIKDLFDGLEKNQCRRESLGQ